MLISQENASMKAVNLHLLTRTHDHLTMSMLYKALSGQSACKMISPHEAASLWTLSDRITDCLCGNPSRSLCAEYISLLDGFYFSYIIRHIGKEFDLLKVSADTSAILNIELKSETVELDRIKKQLEQNRYYLSHIAKTIYSFTYVMETDELYTLNEKGYFKLCEMTDLIRVLQKDIFLEYQKDGIDQCFDAAEYLISPIASPEKFLQSRYFLTNQQFDFRRKCLEHIQEYKNHKIARLVISISGVAGTGKTLLLLNLALCQSEKQKVLFLHSGPLRQGHLIIDSRLRNVDVRSAGKNPGSFSFKEYTCLFIDEADHLDKDSLETVLSGAEENQIPVILSYDPHDLLSEPWMYQTEDTNAEETISLIKKESTLSLSFSGNIRINHPVFAFLRSLLNPKEYPQQGGFDCIEVLYAQDRQEQSSICSYYRSRGYELVSIKETSRREGDIIAQEYDKVLMILDDAFYYDNEQHLRVKEGRESSLKLLYEGLSRTRSRLCLLVSGSMDLFVHILQIRVNSSFSQIR